MGARSALKLAKFKLLLEGTSVVNPDLWDSDDDLAEVDLKEGQQIDMY
jgi:hypothetical protein